MIVVEWKGRLRHVRRLLRVVLLTAIAVVTVAPQVRADDDPDSTQAARDARLAIGVGQLRHALGEWKTTTEFLNPDGSIARSVDGRYTFEWVVPDRVLQGRSDSPALGAAAILFYVRESEMVLEMVSVGPDGRLWVMSGPVDGEVRTTRDVPTADGGMMRLEFERFAVTPNRFESRMHWSTDAGKTWTPGNHQVFVREHEVR